MSNRFLHLEWLLDRLRELGSHHTTADSLESLANLILALVPEGLKPAIVQPDFIHANIVASGRDLVIVDNEFLSIGLGFEFDILNTSHAVSEGDERKRTRYVAEYENVGSCGTLTTHATFWDICYLAKFTGKRFSTGDREMGRVCLELLNERVQGYARERGLQ